MNTRFSVIISIILINLAYALNINWHPLTIPLLILYYVLSKGISRELDLVREKLDAIQKLVTDNLVPVNKKLEEIHKLDKQEQVNGRLKRLKLDLVISNLEEIKRKLTVK